MSFPSWAITREALPILAWLIINQDQGERSNFVMKPPAMHGLQVTFKQRAKTCKNTIYYIYIYSLTSNFQHAWLWRRQTLRITLTAALQWMLTTIACYVSWQPSSSTTLHRGCEHRLLRPNVGRTSGMETSTRGNALGVWQKHMQQLSTWIVMMTCPILF